VLSALWFLTASLPAMAQDIALPREPQLGPRPFYLVDKMKDGPLKQQLSQCTGPFRKTDFFHRPPRRGAEFPSIQGESYLAAAPHGRRCPSNCDVTFTKDRDWSAGTRNATCTPRPTF
jgi:glycerophosphoryl diester phosphodiesterase